MPLILPRGAPGRCSPRGRAHWDRVPGGEAWVERLQALLAVITGGRPLAS